MYILSLQVISKAHWLNYFFVLYSRFSSIRFLILFFCICYIMEFKADWAFYIPLQTFNFWLVPPHYRFLYVAVLNLVYDTFLSFIVHKVRYSRSFIRNQADETCVQTFFLAWYCVNLHSFDMKTRTTRVSFIELSFREIISQTSAFMSESVARFVIITFG